MIYAQINESAITAYPITLAMLKAQNPTVGFPRNALANSDIRAEYGIVEIAKVAKPETETHNVNEVTPTLVDGVWTQTWEQTPKTDNDIADYAVMKRVAEYGTAEQQIEFIVENGLEAWQTKVAAIKAKYPKS